MNDRKKEQSAMGLFLMHLHPKKVNEQALIFTRTFGLGGLNVLLFFILSITGLLLRFDYAPAPGYAYDSMLALQSGGLYGRLLHNMHHWSAMLMLITAFMHLVRVYYSQSIYYERKKTWYYGLILFIIVLAFNFTGYLMPWDQFSYWSVSLMIKMIEDIPFIGVAIADFIRVGDSINGKTLSNYYDFHTSFLPMIFVPFMLVHFWLIRKAKGVTVANQETKKMVDVNPSLINKELIAGAITLVMIVLFSAFVNAPLADKVNLQAAPDSLRAPWFFVGFNELNTYLHPILVTTFIPLALIWYFIYIPKLKINPSKVGVWFYSKMGKRIVISSMFFATVLTFMLILILEHSPYFNSLGLDSYLSKGLIPLLLYTLPSLAYLLYLWIAKKADIIEITLSISTIIFTSYLALSIISIWL